MLFYFTNAALDITLGVCWWILKTTGYVVYGGITYMLPSTSNTGDTMYNKYNMDDSIIILDREELYDRLLQVPIELD